MKDVVPNLLVDVVVKDVVPNLVVELVVNMLPNFLHEDVEGILQLVVGKPGTEDGTHQNCVVDVVGKPLVQMVVLVG